MWSISRATDFLSQHHVSEEPINILLICPGDPNSILKTIANARLSRHQQISFYIVQEQPHILARHFLLLRIAFDATLSIRQRAQMYLDMFGNDKITEQDAEYIKDASRAMLDDMQGVFDLSLLKQRDRDDLEDVFDSWRQPSGTESSCKRDELLRKHYGERYDSRHALVDWDYQMYVKPIACIIHQVQFREWRLSGQAFEFNGALYSMPNPTIALSDTKYTKIDVTNGPFASIGIDCDRSNEYADGLFEVVYKGSGAEQNRYTATDVASYNMASVIYEAITGKRYQMTEKGDVFSGLSNQEAAAQADCHSPNFTIIPVMSCHRIFRGQYFNKFFDSIFVASSSTSILEHDRFYELLKPHTTVFVETSRFDSTKNESFKAKSIEMIRDVLLRANATEINPESKVDDLLIFKMA